VNALTAGGDQRPGLPQANPGEDWRRGIRRGIETQETLHTDTG
jgi:hypothetical protein